MRLVVADTGPLHYLVLIGHVDVLPILFERVFVPPEVCDELAHAEAPKAVREWIGHPPSWLEVQIAVATADDSGAAWLGLDDGEKAAIALADSLGAALVLMDDRKGVAMARQSGFAVTGTLGVLDLAAGRGLVDLAEAFARLRTTNFRYPERILVALLDQHKGRGHT